MVLDLRVVLQEGNHLTSFNKYGKNNPYEYLYSREGYYMCDQTGHLLKDFSSTLNMTGVIELYPLHHQL